MASSDALKLSFNNSNLEQCACTITCSVPSILTHMTPPPRSYEWPPTHHDVNHMESDLRQEDSCMLLSDPAGFIALNAPLDIMMPDIWSIIGDPPLQPDATHDTPHDASHVPIYQFHCQEDLQAHPAPSPPMLTVPSPSPSSELQRRTGMKQDCRTALCMKEDDGRIDDGALAPMKKNRIYERNRRKKLNEKLYSLRALVPKISKMDKASIVSDAIEHVQSLQKQVALRQQDICDLQSRLDAGGRVDVGARTDEDQHLRLPSSSNEYPQYKALKMDVMKIEEETYQLIIEFSKEKRGLVQLVKALELLHLKIVGANATSTTGRMLSTIVLQAKIQQAKIQQAKDLKDIVLKILPDFGFKF